MTAAAGWQVQLLIVAVRALSRTSNPVRRLVAAARRRLMPVSRSGVPDTGRRGIARLGLWRWRRSP